MSMGQFVEDIRLATLQQAHSGLPLSPVHLLSHSGGVIPTEEEVFEAAKQILKNK
jgi:2-oxoglutarate ferredoxin oxidoreductase subunit alpha